MQLLKHFLKKRRSDLHFKNRYEIMFCNAIPSLIYIPFTTVSNVQQQSIERHSEDDAKVIITPTGSGNSHDAVVAKQQEKHFAFPLFNQYIVSPSSSSKRNITELSQPDEKRYRYSDRYTDDRHLANVKDHISMFQCGSPTSVATNGITISTNQLLSSCLSNNSNMILDKEHRDYHPVNHNSIMNYRKTMNGKNGSKQRLLSAGSTNSERNRFYNRNRFQSNSKLSKPIFDHINTKNGNKVMDQHPQYLLSTDYYKNNAFFDRSYYHNK